MIHWIHLILHGRPFFRKPLLFLMLRDKSRFILARITRFVIHNS